MQTAVSTLGIRVRRLVYVCKREVERTHIGTPKADSVMSVCTTYHSSSELFSVKKNVGQRRYYRFKKRITRGGSVFVFVEKNGNGMLFDDA